MEKAFSAKRWIVCFFAGTLVVSILMSAIVYIVDPFFQFRFKDHAYYFTGRFVNAGLIKNYEDYDTVVVGSSMVGNFKMDLFREKLGAKPLKIEEG